MNTEQWFLVAVLGFLMVLLLHIRDHRRMGKVFEEHVSAKRLKHLVGKLQGELEDLRKKNAKLEGGFNRAMRNFYELKIFCTVFRSRFPHCYQIVHNEIWPEHWLSVESAENDVEKQVQEQNGYSYDEMDGACISDPPKYGGAK